VQQKAFPDELVGPQPNGRLLPNKFEIPLIAGNGADLSRNST